MHAEHRPTLRTGPFCIFFSNKAIHPDFLNASQVPERTDLIPGGIALFHAQQTLAGELTAVAARLDFSHSQPVAVLDLAGNTRVGFEAVILRPAAGTGIFLPGIGSTQAAVDPAGSNQVWAV